MVLGFHQVNSSVDHTSPLTGVCSGVLTSICARPRHWDSCKHSCREFPTDQEHFSPNITTVLAHTHTINHSSWRAECMKPAVVHRGRGENLIHPSCCTELDVSPCGWSSTQQAAPCTPLQCHAAMWESVQLNRNSGLVTAPAVVLQGVRVCVCVCSYRLRPWLPTIDLFEMQSSAIDLL